MYFKTITLIRKNKTTVETAWKDVQAEAKKRGYGLIKSFYVHDQVDEFKYVKFLVEVNSKKNWVDDEAMITNPLSTFRLMMVQ
jgi:hypothetical protein